MKVEFEFESGDFVKTKLGDEGIVETAAINDGKISYSVKTRDNCMWWKESELSETGRPPNHN